MSRFLLKYLVCVVLLLTGVSLHAERVARMLYHGAPKTAPKSAVMYAGDQLVGEVPLKRHNFSKSIELTPGLLRLSFLPRELAEGEIVPVNAPFVDIPKKWKKVLILVFEDPNNPIMPIRLKAINANDNLFGPGEVLFVNLSEVAIFGMVGDQKLVCKPATTALISQPTDKKGPYYVQLDSVVDNLESRRWFVRQTWQHIPSVRNVVFILPLPSPRLVKLYNAPIRNF